MDLVIGFTLIALAGAAVGVALSWLVPGAAVGLWIAPFVVAWGLAGLVINVVRFDVRYFQKGREAKRAGRSRRVRDDRIPAAERPNVAFVLRPTDFDLVVQAVAAVPFVVLVWH